MHVNTQKLEINKEKFTKKVKKATWITIDKNMKTGQNFSQRNKKIDQQL